MNFYNIFSLIIEVQHLNFSSSLWKSCVSPGIAAALEQNKVLIKKMCDSTNESVSATQALNFHKAFTNVLIEMGNTLPGINWLNDLRKEPDDILLSLQHVGSAFLINDCTRDMIKLAYEMKPGRKKMHCCLQWSQCH